MWSTEFKYSTKASKEIIWELWKDVDNWKEWDISLEYSTIDGKFENGINGVLKSKKGPKSTFVLLDCIKNQSFTTRSKLPFGKIDFIHLIIENNNQLEIIHRVEISGFFTFMFSKIIGKSLKKTLPLTVKNLILKAEERIL